MFQLALAALRNRGDCWWGRTTRDKRDVSHVHVCLCKARLGQGWTTVAGYLASPLAYTRGVHVTPCLTHGYLGVRVWRYNSRIMKHFTFKNKWSFISMPSMRVHGRGYFMFVTLLEYETLGYGSLVLMVSFSRKYYRPNTCWQTPCAAPRRIAIQSTVGTCHCAAVRSLTGYPKCCH